MKGRGRGRGRGRGGFSRSERSRTLTKSHEEIEMAEVDQNSPRQRSDRTPPTQSHKAYFTWLTAAVTIIYMIWELVECNGFVPFRDNPLLGPSVECLLYTGAKFGENLLAGEWWRFITPIFLHAGIIHIILNLVALLRLGRSLEKTYGSVRVALIYLLSGIYGNIFSAIFIPNAVTVGASGAIFGFIGVLLVDLIQNWSLLQNPLKNLLVLSISIIISLGIGLLPGIDNFAHIGGFVMGIFSGFVFLPHLAPSAWNKKSKFCTIIVCLPVTVAIIAISLIAFYAGVTSDGFCDGCNALNCIPVENFCSSPPPL